MFLNENSLGDMERHLERKLLKKLGEMLSFDKMYTKT